MAIITIAGKVKKGQSRGRKIGFPTLNVLVPQAIGKDQWGVYFSLVRINDKVYPALTHLGPPKTFHLSQATCESHLLSLRGDISAKSVKKTLILKIREVKKFSSIKELKKQIQQDIKAAKEFFGL